MKEWRRIEIRTRKRFLHFPPSCIPSSLLLAPSRLFPPSSLSYLNIKSPPSPSILSSPHSSFFLFISPVVSSPPLLFSYFHFFLLLHSFFSCPPITVCVFLPLFCSFFPFTFPLPVLSSFPVHSFVFSSVLSPPFFSSHRHALFFL